MLPAFGIDQLVLFCIKGYVNWILFACFAQGLVWALPILPFNYYSVHAANVILMSVSEGSLMCNDVSELPKLHIFFIGFPRDVVHDIIISDDVVYIFLIEQTLELFIISGLLAKWEVCCLVSWTSFTTWPWQMVPSGWGWRNVLPWSSSGAIPRVVLGCPSSSRQGVVFSSVNSC